MADLTQYPHAMGFDPDTGKPMQKVFAQSVGDTVVDQKTQADAVTGKVSFTENITYLEIYNRDATNDGVFVVNGINITVPKGEVFKAKFGGTPSKDVTVTGSTLYILTRYK